MTALRDMVRQGREDELGPLLAEAFGSDHAPVIERQFRKWIQTEPPLLLRAHWRRWPELGWLAADRGCAPEELPEHPAWREEGAALLEEARGMEPAPGLAAGLEGEVAALERMRLRDDCGRFERGWQALGARAIREGVPELHAEGYEEVAELAGWLSEAEGLDPAARRVAAAWRKAHDRQSALADAVRSLPDRAEAWRTRREADLPLDEHGAADPVDPAWREEGEALQDEAEAMLAEECAHRPHMDAMSGARESIAGAPAGEDRTHKAAEQARVAAEQQRLEEKRKQDRSEGGGMKLQARRSMQDRARCAAFVSW